MAEDEDVQPEPDPAPEAQPSAGASGGGAGGLAPQTSHTDPSVQRRVRLLVLSALFFVSGAAGLVYEVAWSKRLELTFGATTYSIGIVLAAYMSGLGLGAWWFGKLADRPGSPAKRYALMEIGIGIYGLLAPWILDLMEVVYVAAGGGGGLLLKAVLGLIAILPPTILMGGTLPVLARALVRERGETQQAVGLLYGINTVGAVCGTVLAGFLLVSTLGMDATSRWTGVLNLLLGILVLALGERVAAPITGALSEEAAQPSPDGPEARELRAKIALWATFGCGAVALALEVAWTRALSLAFGSTGHGFTIVLAATLLGIGLGSLIVARVARDERAPLALLAGALLLLAGSGYVFQLGYEVLPKAFYVLAQPRPLPYEGLLGMFFLIATLSLLPSTIGLGIAFPLAVQLGTPAAGEAGHKIGRLYLANTAGAILGSLLGAFALIPLLGTQGVIRLGTCLAALGGGALAWSTVRCGGWPERPARLVAALGLVLGVGALGAPAWDSRLLDMGPTRLRGTGLPRQPGQYYNAFRRVGMPQVYAKEGLNAFVTVRASGSNVSLLTGGKADASDPGDMETQMLLGAVGFFAAPDAERTLIVGAGSGVTVSVAAGFASVKQVDVVEIETAMVEAARLHFRHSNRDVFDRESVRVIYDDARSFLQTAPEASYDVIISEPSNPSIAGIANLFTADLYATAKKRLKPGGVYAQWVQLYQTDDWMARAMLNTFVQAFEHVDLWWSHPADLILVGSDQPIEYDREVVANIVASNKGLSEDLWPRLYCRTSDDLFARFVLHKDELEPLVRSGEILRDKLPRLEAYAARARYEQQGSATLHADITRKQLGRGTFWPRLRTPPTDAKQSEQRLRVAAARYMSRAHPKRALKYIEGLQTAEAVVIRARITSSPMQRRVRLRKALAKYPQDTRVRLELARVEANLRNRIGAVETLAPLNALSLEQRSALPADYFLLRARLIEPKTQAEADQVVEQIEACLARILPRIESRALRIAGLGQLAEAAKHSQRAVTVLKQLYAKRWWDTEAGRALAEAYFNRREYEDCLRAIELIEIQNDLGHEPGVQLLKLQVLAELKRPGLNAAVRRYLRAFPTAANNPKVHPFIRRLRRRLGDD